MRLLITGAPFHLRSPGVGVAGHPLPPIGEDASAEIPSENPLGLLQGERQNALTIEAPPLATTQVAVPGGQKHRFHGIGRRESRRQDHRVLQAFSAQYTQQTSKTSPIRLDELRRRLVQKHRRARAQRESRLHAYRRRCHRLRHALKGKKRRLQLHFHF